MLTLISLFLNDCYLYNTRTVTVFLHSPRERAQAHRTLRRQDKKLKEMLASIEDERKQAEAYKGDVSKRSHQTPLHEQF